MPTTGPRPYDTVTQVSVRDGELSVTHDLSDEPAMPIASYAIYEVANRDDVVEWTTRFMELHRRIWPGWTGQAEIRQVIAPQGHPPRVAVTDTCAAGRHRQR